MIINHRFAKKRNPARYDSAPSEGAIVEGAGEVVNAAGIMERMVAEERAVTDSAWFWVCLFAAAALIGLAAIGPKYARRQAQIEREFQGRQRAAQNVQGQAPTVTLSTPEQTLIKLQPLFYAFATVIAVGWFVFWRRRGLKGRSFIPKSDL